MSLLLDALKKSEQERKQGEEKSCDDLDPNMSNRDSESRLDFGRDQSSSSNFLAQRISSITPAKKIIYVGAVSLTVGIGYALYEPQVEVEESFAPSITEQSLEPLLNEKMEAELQAKMANVFAATPEMLDHVQKQGIPTEINQETIRSKMESKSNLTSDSASESLQTLKTFQSQQSQHSLSEDKNSDSGPAISIYQLPPNLKSQVPTLKFEGLLYSSDAEYRSVTINGRKLQEGDWFNSNIKLLKITEQNVTYAVQGVQFSVPVMTDYVAE